MKINIQDKTITIDLSKAFQNKKIDFKAMTEAQKLQYALSFVGLNKKSIELPKKYKLLELKTSNFALNQVIDKRYKNHFLNLQRDACKIGTHKPLSNFKYFGVEIECLIPFDSLNISKGDYSGNSTHECSNCEGSGRMTFTHRDSGHEIEGDCPSCDGSGEIESDDSSDESQLFDACRDRLADKIKTLNIKGIDIKEDGSLDAEDESDELWCVELTVLFRQDDMTSLNKLCGLLNKLGAKVNSSCGLHVHMDARHLTEGQVLRIGKKFSHALPFMSEMVPKSRVNNRFCALKVSTLNGERYCAVNLTAFKKYKTIEIRLHSSTTSFDKIANWIKILSLITDAKLSKLESMTSIQNFFEVIKADADLQNYIISRRQKFSGKAEETPCEAEIESEDDTLTLEAV